MLTFFFAGFLGGVIRGILGITKHVLSYKDVKMRWLYFSSLALISGLIGLVAAWIVQQMGISLMEIEVLSPAIALIVGYAGGDFLENIFKVIIKKPILFEQEKK